ncbi:hypothetical protein V6N12_057371 [Hibiscus sabdariffa]|uniref:Uncharacterized protein n=1 Tax=Hibiscus sabdariffa TaxID=183260 RepID=A0ABR2DDD0_9ROSI
MSAQNPTSVSRPVPAYLNMDGRPPDLQAAAMDVDGGEGKQAAVHISDDVGGKIDNSVTYASVTTKSTLNGSSQKPLTAAIDEDIVILEEDVDKLQGGKEQPQPVLQSIQATTSKPHSVAAVNTSPKKNATYLESNPGRKNKSITGSPSMVKVVLSLEGKEATTMVHKPCVSAGVYEAIIITEQGAMASGTSGHRSSKSRVSGTRSISDFITDLNGRMDTLQDPITQHPPLSIMAMDRDDVRLGGSKEISSDTDSRYEEGHGDDVILVDQ